MTLVDYGCKNLFLFYFDLKLRCHKEEPNFSQNATSVVGRTKRVLVFWLM